MTLSIYSIETLFIFGGSNTLVLLIILYLLYGELTSSIGISTIKFASKFEIIFTTGFLLGSAYLYSISKEESDKNDITKDEASNATNTYFGFMLANLFTYIIYLILLFYYMYVRIMYKSTF